MNRTHPLAQKKSLKAAELQGEKIYLYEDETSFPMRAREILLEREIVPADMSFPSFVQILPHLLLGDGVAITNQRPIAHERLVFIPLDMERTAWYFKDVDVNLMAIPHGYNTLLRQPRRYGFYGYPTYPDGALKTSVNEFARFLSVFINEGKTFEGQPFLKAETVKEMLTLQTFRGMEKLSVGLAWHSDDGRIFYHNGGDPGITTVTYFNPETNQGAIYFSNGGEFNDLTGVARGIVLFDQMESILLGRMAAP
jgi:hypothetical protein